MVSDFTGREVRMTREVSSGRVTQLTDPLGHSVKYEYDTHGNLMTVTDRSGRKRFYIYDTPEAKKLFPDNDTLTGGNPHLLVDVRVDDDSDLISNFNHATFGYMDALPAAGATGDALLATQNYPGDVSIMQVGYDANGRMSAIETAAGGVGYLSP